MAINTRIKSAISINKGNVGSENTNISLKLARAKWTKFAMAWMVVFMSVLLTSYLILPIFTDGLTANLISKHYKLQYSSSSIPHEFFVRDVDGSVIKLFKTVDGKKVTLITSTEALKIVDKQLNKKWFSSLFMNWYLLWSIAGTALAFYAVFLLNRFFEEKGTEQTDDEFVRGGQLITVEDYLKESAGEREEDGAEPSEITIADIPFPKKGDERLGILFYGNAGVGKSNLQFDLMRQVFKAGRKSVIYSRTGEEFEMFYRPGKDVLFAPAYKGSEKWNLFADMRLRTDGAKMARSFVPVKKDEDFFQVAARTVFDKTLMALHARGETNTAAIAETIYTFDDESIESLLKGTSAFNTLGQGKQRAGVLGSLNIYLDSLTYILGGDFSLREWMRKDDDSRLFLLGLEETEDAFMSFNRIALDILLSEIAVINKKHSDDKYWFFLDEMPSLGLGPKNCIQVAMNQKRKYGVCISAGIQADRQLYEDAGQDSAINWLNAFQTTVALRLTDKDTKDSVIARLGDADIAQKSVNSNYAVNNDRDGAGTSSQITPDVSVVQKTEISLLKNNTGYLKFAAYNPIKINIKHWGKVGRMNREEVNEIELHDDIILDKSSISEAAVKQKMAVLNTTAAPLSIADFDELPYLPGAGDSDEDLPIQDSDDDEFPFLSDTNVVDIKPDSETKQEESEGFW